MPRNQQQRREPHEEERDRAVVLRDEAATLTVMDGDTFSAAGEWLLKIKAARSRIAEILDPIIRAAHNAHKVALKQKGEAEKPLVEADKYLRQQIENYNQKTKEDAAREALALSRRGELSLPAEAPKVDGISFKKRWLFEVYDADAVPREFLIVDESLIRKRVEALGEAAGIPGVRVWSHESSIVKG